jgi:hypothetical protein
LLAVAASDFLHIPCLVFFLLLPLLPLPLHPVLLVLSLVLDVDFFLVLSPGVVRHRYL